MEDLTHRPEWRYSTPWSSMREKGEVSNQQPLAHMNGRGRDSQPTEMKQKQTTQKLEEKKETPVKTK